jgi:C-terminal processing protease CtpA/Prc
VKRLDGNVGYIDLREFVPVGVGAATATAAMNLIADTEALIIDLRNNDGGRQDMAAHIASYLFSEPTQLSSRHNYVTGETTHYWTSGDVEGQRFGDKPLYLLTSHETFSAAECFAYDMKQLGRATLVGETTAGGANPTKIYTLTPHVWMAIPYGYHVNPVTGTDWEGVGVPPDVEVEAERALGEAHRLALLGIRETVDRDWPPRLLGEFLEEVDRALERLADTE